MMNKKLVPYFSAAIKKNGNPDKWSGQAKQKHIDNSPYKKIKK